MGCKFESDKLYNGLQYNNFCSTNYNMKMSEQNLFIN